MECQRSTVHSLYRNIVNSGLAFGAKRWISMLQQQCDRLVFLVATNVPVKDSNGNELNPQKKTLRGELYIHVESCVLMKAGVGTMAGRKSIMQLAQRMSRNLCRAIGDSSFNSWNKITTKTGDEIRVATRKNQNDAGEPLGTILSAVSCHWLPVPHHALFEFLRDETRRNEVCT